jgi:hypothetical protein
MLTAILQRATKIAPKKKKKKRKKERKFFWAGRRP